MNFSIFEQIGAVPAIIHSFKKELIGMQYDYATEKVNTLIKFCNCGIATKGTYEQYRAISRKLNKPKLELLNIHNVLAKEEIELLLPDRYIEEDYSLWYRNEDNFNYK